MEDKDIIARLIDELGFKSVNAFSKEVGYSSPSAIYLILGGERKITEHLIKKILENFPNVNEPYLRGQGDKTSMFKSVLDEQKEMSQDDLPRIMIELLKEQKETNRLLKTFLSSKKQGL